MSTSFLTTIETLARKMAADAVKPETSLETRIEVFKALAPYTTFLLKQQGKSDEEGDGLTFGDLGAGFNGRAEIRNRRERRPGPGPDSEPPE